MRLFSLNSFFTGIKKIAAIGGKGSAVTSDAGESKGGITAGTSKSNVDSKSTLQHDIANEFIFQITIQYIGIKKIGGWFTKGGK